MADEKSASAPWMKEMRSLLHGAEVVKHSDGSMIGLPDCSVTYGGRVAWVEFKFDFLDDRIEDLLGDEDPTFLAMFLLTRHRKNAEAQYEKVCALGRQSLGLYLFFVHKTCVVALEPTTGACRKTKDAAEAASLVAKVMRRWEFQQGQPFADYCA